MCQRVSARVVRMDRMDCTRRLTGAAVRSGRAERPAARRRPCRAARKGCGQSLVCQHARAPSCSGPIAHAPCLPHTMLNHLPAPSLPPFRAWRSCLWRWRRIRPGMPSRPPPTTASPLPRHTRPVTNTPRSAMLALGSICEACAVTVQALIDCHGVEITQSGRAYAHLR